MLNRLCSCPAKFLEKKQLEIDFKNCKTHVQRELRTSKNMWCITKARQIHISTDTHDSKSLYNQLRAAYGPPASIFAPLCSKDNILLRNPDEVKARWREYFNDLLNRRYPVDFVVIGVLPQAFPQLLTMDELDRLLQRRKRISCEKERASLTKDSKEVVSL